MHFTSANISRFTLTIANQSLSDPEFRVYQFELNESISDHYKLKINFVSEDHHIEPESLLKHLPF